MSAVSNVREEITIVWRIENFSPFCFEVLGNISSPSFIEESFSLTRGKLRLYSKNGYIICTLDGRHKHNKELVINEKIDLISVDGEILESKEMKGKIYSPGKPLDNEIVKINDLIKKIENCKEDTLIIHYYFTVGEKRKTTAARYEFKTRIGVNRCSFQCKVANFELEDWEEVKNFYFPDIALIDFIFTAPEDFLLVNIKNFDEDATAFRIATCRVFLLDVEGVKRQSKKYSHLFDIKEHTASWKFSSFITKTQLNSEARTFLKNGAFSLMCEFSVSNGTIEYEVHNMSEISSPVNIFNPTDPFASLKEDLRSMLTSKKHSDVKLQVGEDIFPAHKSFLAARSPVFSTMFDQDMLENQPEIVSIPDMDAETLNSLLSFVYTGTVDNMNYEVALKLLVAAGKYQVESLKEKCASFLESNLSDGNACEVLAFADMVGYKLLKEYVQDYIKARAAKILTSREWLQWVEKNNRLASEIFSKLSLHFGSLALEE